MRCTRMITSPAFYNKAIIPSHIVKPVKAKARSMSEMARPKSSFPSQAVGMLTKNGMHLGSGVLIHKNYALTSAHCVMHTLNEYSNRLEMSFPNGDKFGVSSFLAHPRCNSRLWREDAVQNDIAVLFLEQEAKDIAAAKVSYDDHDIENNCDVVGYPQDLSGVKEPVQLAFKSTYRIDAEYQYAPKVIESKVGYQYDALNDLVPTLDPLYSQAIAPGMSGGGLFMADGSLVGINQGSLPSPDYNFFVRLSIHQAWLSNVLGGSMQSPILVDHSSAQCLQRMFADKFLFKQLTINTFNEKGYITITGGRHDLANVTQFLLRNGFNIAVGSMPIGLITQPKVIVMGETSKSFEDKLSAIEIYKHEHSLRGRSS